MNKNCKIFGKINVIDFIVILIVVFAIAAAGVFVIRNRKAAKTAQAQNTTLIMKFYTEELSDFVADKLKVGSVLYDDDKDVNLGTMTNVEIGSSVVYGGINAGSYEVVNKEGYKSAVITGEVTGVKNELGALIGGEQYGVGHSMVLRAGDAKIYLRVYDIGIKSDIETQEKQDADKKQTIEITYEADEIKGYAANAVKVGDELCDMTNGTTLGTVTQVSVNPAKVYVETDSGKIVVSDKEGYNSIVIKGEVSAELLENGVLKVGDKEYSVGKTFVLRAGNVMMYEMDVSNIAVK